MNNKKLYEKNNFFIYLPNKEEIVPVDYNPSVKLEDLKFIDEQKRIVITNTNNFANNKISNNIFLWGAKGMGKSTLIKSALASHNESNKQKIKLIEVLNNNLEHLPDIVYEVSSFKKKSIIFIDDVSFEKPDKSFSLFKSLLEGSILSNIKDLKYYITSNLRHLSHKNIDIQKDEIKEKEMNNNLISLSDRFGCWVGFHNCSKEEYLNIIKHYIKKYSIKNSSDIIKMSLQWSISKGGYSGRTAYQFISSVI